MPMRQFIIDTDTASDDAVALIMALRAPDVTVEAITVVCGNVAVDQGVRNALYTVELCGADVPVYGGVERPLLREPVHAEGYHGVDGLGDQGYPPPTGSAAPDHAVDVLIETIKAHPGIELVTLGPLTNIALALARAPEIVPLVSRCVVMGGNAWTVGNVTPAAEFNMWHDPDAARRVLHSGLPIELVPWELCRHEAVITPDDIAHIRALDTPLGHFAVDCNSRAIEAAFDLSGQIGIDLADPVAMAVALDPTICTRRSKHAVDVETHSELTRGLTVVDQLNMADDPYNRAHWGPIAACSDVTICWAIDPARWKAMLYRSLT
jgi:purine nucleosidase